MDCNQNKEPNLTVKLAVNRYIYFPAANDLEIIF